MILDFLSFFFFNMQDAQIENNAMNLARGATAMFSKKRAA